MVFPLYFPTEPRIARVSRIKFKLFLQFWGPNPSPGRLPSDSGRGDVELAGVFVSVVSVAVSFVSECIFWSPVEKHSLKYARANGV